MEVVEQAKLYTRLVKKSELLVDLSNLLCLVLWSLADKGAIKGYPAHYCRKMSASVEVSWKQRNSMVRVEYRHQQRARITVYEVSRNILLRRSCGTSQVVNAPGERSWSMEFTLSVFVVEEKIKYGCQVHKNYVSDTNKQKHNTYMRWILSNIINHHWVVREENKLSIFYTTSLIN